MKHQFTSFQTEVYDLINLHFDISKYNLTFDDDLSITFKNGIKLLVFTKNEILIEYINNFYTKKDFYKLLNQLEFLGC